MLTWQAMSPLPCLHRAQIGNHYEGTEMACVLMLLPARYWILMHALVGRYVQVLCACTNCCAYIKKLFRLLDYAEWLSELANRPHYCIKHLLLTTVASILRPDDTVIQKSTPK